MKRILFVCTGNTCRSPLAEAILKNKLAGIDVQSAGVSAFPGSDASGGTKQVLSELGIACDHRAQLIDRTLIQWADVVLTMTEGHKQLVVQQFPEYEDKVYTLKQFVGAKGESENISDPFGGSVEIYRQTAQELEQLIEELIEKHLHKS